MSAILNAGRDLIAQKQAAGQPLIIDRFIFANIPGLDETQPVNLDEPMPAAGDIVLQDTVTNSGYVNADQVVYSMMLDANIGDFDFNWIGLQADDNTLVAVSYVPLQHKRKTVGLNLGNTITRNFVLAFNDAQATTNITVSAATWQIDFMARLDDQDQRERQSNEDIYGEQAFCGDGYLVWNDAGTHKLKAGYGYVNGVRINNASEQTLTPGALPKDVWLDVSLLADATRVAEDVQLVFDTAAQSDFVDGNNRQHYLVKIASIDAGGAVTDLRNSYPISNGLLPYLKPYIDNILEFNTVADMVAATWLQVGMVCKTLGYKTIGDGGGNEYEIVAAATGTHDGGSYIDLATHQAKGLFPNGEYAVEQWGAVGDKTADDTTSIQACYDYVDTVIAAVTVEIPIIRYHSTNAYKTTAQLSSKTTAVHMGNGAAIRPTVNVGGQAALVLGKSGSNVYRTTVHNLDVLYSGTSLSSGIKLLNSQQTTLNRCYISGFAKQIEAASDTGDPLCAWLMIKDCYLQGGDYGFYSAGVPTNVVAIVDTPFLHHAKNAVYADPVTRFTIRNIDFSNCATDTGNALIRIKNGGNISIQEIYTEAIGDGAGGYCELIQLDTCHDVVITNNYLNGASQGTWRDAKHVKHGIRLYNCRNTTIQDNHFSYLQEQSVLLDAACGEGNVIGRNSYEDLQTGIGNKYQDLSGKAKIDIYEPPTITPLPHKFIENFIGAPKEIADQWAQGVDTTVARNALTAPPFSVSGQADRIDFTGAGTVKEVSYATANINNTASQIYELRFFARLDSIVAGFESELAALRVRIYDEVNAVYLTDEYVYLPKDWAFFSIPVTDAQVNSHTIKVTVQPLDQSYMKFSFGLVGLQYCREGSPYLYGEQYANNTVQRDSAAAMVGWPLLLVKDDSDHAITFGTAPPTAGIWKRGDICFNTAPVAGGYIGWSCVDDAGPLTWKGFGQIEA